MFKNLRRYGIYKPYVLTVSIIVAIVMFFLHEPLSVLIGIASFFLVIMTLIRNVYRYRFIQALITDQNLDNSIHALDLATKKGYSLVQLTNRAPSAFVDGMEEDTDDYTNEAIKNAKRDSDISRIQLTHGDVRYLPYPSDHFDVITIMPTASSKYVSRRESDYQDAFQEAIRVLSPKGIALLVMPKKAALRGAKYLYSQDEKVDVYLAKPAHQSLFGYQPIVIKKKNQPEHDQ